jgi:hypothetical protein
MLIPMGNFLALIEELKAGHTGHGVPHAPDRRGARPPDRMPAGAIGTWTRTITAARQCRDRRLLALLPELAGSRRADADCRSPRPGSYGEELGSEKGTMLGNQ